MPPGTAAARAYGYAYAAPVTPTEVVRTVLLEVIIFTLLVAAAALFLQDRCAIPTPISMIVIVLLAKLAGYQPITISDGYFDEIVIVLLPILICVDAMSLRWSEVKRHGLALGYLAGLMVLLSIGVAVVLNRNILPDYHLSVPAVAALFCMIAATDPVSVSSVFGKFHLPHSLKILAEGESLFNDASALIIFAIALTYMGHGGERHVDNIVVYSLTVIVGALAVGLVTGYAGLWVLSVVHNPMAETLIVLAMAFTAYTGAEHFHMSGILAVIVAVLFANNVITRRIEAGSLDDDGGAATGFERARRLLIDFQALAKDTTAYQIVLANIQYTAILAASIVFISTAAVVRFDLLLRYWQETLSVFIGMTLIRMLMLGLFAGLGRLAAPMPAVPLHWWMILSAAGVKGAVSLLMLHMIPHSFAYRELFEAIVVGNVLLSTFLYPPVLILVLKAYQRVFEHEYAHDHLQIEE